MPGKRRIIYSIDTPAAGAFNAGPDPGGTGGTLTVVPPAQAAAGPPTNLALTTAIERNAVTPTSLIAATWYPPAGVAPQSYVIQWSTSSVFATSNGGAAASESATISGLIPNTLYYVRVAAFVQNTQGEWSTTASITTAADTTAPNPVTSPAGVFVGGGDLVITWVNSTSANFRDVELVIRASNGGTILATVYSATQQRIWTVADNLAATAGAGDPTIWVDLRARSWGGIFSTTVNTGLITKAAPAAPTVTLIGGFSLLVASVTSAPESPYSLFQYQWLRDAGVITTVLTGNTSETYTAGSTAGDEGSHSWTVKVRERDAFGQFSAITTSSAFVLDTLTITFLRAGLIFSDSIGTARASLDVLKDGDLDAPGISYAA